MAIRFDAAGDRVYLAATLPAPAAAGLTILGWWQMRVDRNDYSVYYRTSGAGGSPTIHSVSAFNTGISVSVFTTSGELNTDYINVVDEWMAIAVVDTGSGVSLYMQPFGQATQVFSGTVGTGTPGQLCIGGRALNNATEWFNGNAAHVRVFADALTQAEVEAEWASSVPVLTAWASYPLVDNIQDASGNGRHLTAVAGTPAFEPGPDLSEPEEPVAPGPVWSRVRVAHPRLVRGRPGVGGRLSRAGRRPA